MQKKSVLICLIILCAYISANAQVKIGDNPTNINENSLLELESTNKGFVFPGVSLDDISSPSPMTGSVLPGTIVYNTNLLTTGGLGAGLYIWNGSQWAYLKQSTDAGSSDNWSTTGNSGSISNTKFLGTSDNNGLSIRTSNLEALHIDSLQNVSVGTISSDNRFETLGKFRLHSGDFSVMYSPDILPGFFPGIEFAGTQHNSADTAYMFSGIVNLPPVFEANEPLAAITGYLNPSSQINTLLNITKTNINANTNNGIKGSGINLDMENGVNLYSQKNDKNSNTNSNLNLNDNGVSLSYYTNASGNQENTGLNLNSTSLYFNAYQGAWNRYSNMNLSTTDYSINVSSQDTSNSMGHHPRHAAAELERE